MLPTCPATLIIMAAVVDIEAAYRALQSFRKEPHQQRLEIVALDPKTPYASAIPIRSDTDRGRTIGKIRRSRGAERTPSKLAGVPSSPDAHACGSHRSADMTWR